MFYIIYSITNIIDNKTYIGYHATSDLNDTYMGSGKHLKNAIKKYGIDNFQKQILYVFPTKDEALQKEREIVNEEFVNRQDTYNIKLGGEGGWDHTWNDPKRIEATKRSFIEGRNIGWRLTPDQRISIAKSAFLGKTHTHETKIKIGAAQKLEDKILESRIADYNSIEKRWGYIGKLAKMWNISHTQVRRFIQDYCI